MLRLLLSRFQYEQEAETRVKRMEDEMHELAKELNEKVEQIRASDVATEKVRIVFFHIS